MVTRLENRKVETRIPGELTEVPSGTETHGLTIAYGLDVGLRPPLRGKGQEDNVRVFSFGQQIIAVLADGVGGNGKGDEASRVTVTTLPQRYAVHKNNGLSDEQALAQAVIDTGEAVSKIDKDPDKGSPTSTVFAAVLNKDGTGIFVRAGDSRGYIVSPEGEIKRVARDQSVVDELVEKEEITDDGRYTHPKRNLVTAVITEGDPQTGQEGPLSMSDLSAVYDGTLPMPRDHFIGRFKLSPGERLLLCSDGLWEMVRDPELAEIITTQEKEHPTYAVQFTSIRFQQDGHTFEAVGAISRTDHQIEQDKDFLDVTLPDTTVFDPVLDVEPTEVSGIDIELSPHGANTELRVKRYDIHTVEGRAIVVMPTHNGAYEVKTVKAAGGRVYLPIGSIVLVAEDETNIAINPEPKVISANEIAKLVQESKNNFGLSLIEFIQQQGFIVPEKESASFAIVEVKPSPPQAIIDRLIATANENGGADNISAILLQADEINRSRIVSDIAPSFDLKTLRKKFLRVAYGFVAKSYKPIADTDINPQTTKLFNTTHIAAETATFVYPKGDSSTWRASHEHVYFSGEHAETGLTREYTLDTETFLTRALGARIIGEEVLIPFGFDGLNLAYPEKMLCLRMTKAEYKKQLEALAGKLDTRRTRRVPTAFSAMIAESLRVLGL